MIQALTAQVDDNIASSDRVQEQTKVVMLLFPKIDR